MAIVGYARVSTRDQDLAGQLAELKAAGCELVYREKSVGCRFRPEGAGPAGSEARARRHRNCDAARSAGA
jgi:Resolvase, N terminal domain